MRLSPCWNRGLEGTLRPSWGTSHLSHQALLGVHGRLESEAAKRRGGKRNMGEASAAGTVSSVPPVLPPPGMSRILTKAGLPSG